MKHSLKFFRFSLVLLLALTVVLSAAVGVSADTIEPDLVIFRANASKQIQSRFQLNQLYTMSYPDAAYMGLFSNIPLEADTTYVINILIKAETINAYSNNIVYIASLPNTIATWDGSGNLNGIANVNFHKSSGTGGTTVEYIITLNTANLNSSDLNTYFYLITSGITSGQSTEFRALSMDVICTYDPNGDIMLDISNKLDNIINNQINNNNTIQSSLNQIISNQDIQNNNWQTIITYGNSYDQIDQTIINNLESTEDQLKNAEDALENKSQSLKDSVASQWSNIQSSSKTFIQDIAPAAAAVGTVTTQFMNAAPEEVKGMFLTIPLLIFIGWLIGRIRGD